MIKKFFCMLLALLICVACCACSLPDMLGSTEPTSAAGADISLDFTVPTITVPEVTVSGGAGAQIEIDLPDITIDFTMEPMVVQPHSFEINLPTHDFQIDVESFSVSEFKEDSSINFSDADLEKIESMDASQVAQIAQTKANLLLDLQYAFENAGIHVQIDETNGEITMDSSVLFATDESAVSEEGKALLKQFMEVYTFVVFHERYEGFVSKILIEGHTDTAGSYDHNLALSQARADSVMAFCLSDECGLADTYGTSLQDMMQATGYSYDRPVYDANGEVDMAASRRVTFRFLISVE